MHQQCGLLALPTEVRNYIYEPAFSSDNHEGASPTKALLLSCRQIWQEARGLHKVANDSYWSTTPFIIRHEEIINPSYSTPSTEKDLARVRDRKLLTSMPRLKEVNYRDNNLWSWPINAKVTLKRSPMNSTWIKVLETGRADREQNRLYCVSVFDPGPGDRLNFARIHVDEFASRAHGHFVPVTKYELEELLWTALKGMGCDGNVA